LDKTFEGLQGSLIALAVTTDYQAGSKYYYTYGGVRKPPAPQNAYWISNEMNDEMRAG
jgi:hypothetical protein